MNNDEEIKHPSKTLNLFEARTLSTKMLEKKELEPVEQVIESLKKEKKDLSSVDQSIDERKIFKMPFGDGLKQARIYQNFSYQDVYNMTKISIKFLQNLEEEKFANFPDSTYVKAHLKKLCQFYKLSYDILLGQYELLTGKKLKSKIRTNKVLVKTKIIKKNKLINIDFFILHYRLISTVVGIILLFILFQVFNFSSLELMVVDLSIFIEEYKLPEHKFIIPLGGY